MKVIKITGGLGNQMFQYLYGQHLSLKYNDEVQYDISSFQNQPDFLDERKCELTSFKFNFPIVNNSHFSQFKKLSNKKKIIHFLRNFLLNSSKTFLPIPEFYSQVSNFIPSFIRNRYFFGYWQTDRFYNAVKDKCPNIFELSQDYEHLLVNQHHQHNIQNENSVSLQVRRGDFLGENEWICDLDYYFKAISIISDHVDNPKYFIFSDDIEWCKKELKFDIDITFVEPNFELPFEDMMLMSSCKHNIIVNSTFGWWGATLNSNPIKVCISPKKWSSSLNDYKFIKV